MPETRRNSREDFVKVYDLDSVKQEMKGMRNDFRELKDTIDKHNTTFYTKTEVDLLLSSRDNRIDSMKRTILLYNKVIWLIVSALVPLIALTVWQLILNSNAINTALRTEATVVLWRAD